MHDDVTTGLIAGAGDGLQVILVLVLGLMVLGMMGHWWFWAMVVPAGVAWWMLARRRRRLDAAERAAARIAARFPVGRVR
jgi:hypothetical protein